MAYPFEQVRRDLDLAKLTQGSWLSRLTKPFRRSDQLSLERFDSHRHVMMEFLEPRVLLSADFTPEAAAAMADGADKLGDRVAIFLNDDDILGDRVPILLKTSKDASGNPVYESPTVLDLLSVPVDANLDGKINPVNGFDLDPFDNDESVLDALDVSNNGVVDPGEFLQSWFFNPIEGYLNNVTSGDTTDEFETFLKGVGPFNLDQHLDALSGLYDVKFEIVDAKVADTTENPDAEFTFSVGFELSVTQSMPFDLGLQADALKILPFTGSADNPQQPKVPVTSKLSFAFDFGVYTGGQTAGDINAQDFFIRKAEPMVASVKSDVPDIPDFHLNIGFLGADVVDGSLKLQADVETALLDPNDPIVLGFTDAQHGVEQTGGTVTAANALTTADLAHEAGFFLRIGNLGIATPVTVLDNNSGGDPLSAVTADIDAALVAAGLGDIVDVSLDGANKVKFDLVATTATPLGFADESLSQVGVLLASPDGDGPNSYEFNASQSFLLSLGGARPKVVTVRFPDPSHTDIGFNNGQVAGATPLIASNAPSAFDVSGDANFTVTVRKNDGTEESFSFTLTAAETDGNLNVADLALDIDDQMIGSSIYPLVQAIAGGDGRIRFTPLDGTSAIRVQASGTATSEIGFAADAMATLGLVAANSAVANLSDPARFKLTLTTDTGGGTSTSTALVVVPDNDRANLNDLAADINAVIDSAVGSNRIDAFVSGGKILLKALDADVLAFSVTTINENLADLVGDVNQALAEAGFAGQVTASEQAGLLKLTSTGSKSLEISRTLTFDAGVTYAELVLTPTDGLFGVSEGAASKVELKLPVHVLPGLEDATTGADDDFQPANVAIVGNFNPFTSAAASFDDTVNRFKLNFTYTPAPTVPEQDAPVGSVPAVGSLTNEVRLVNFAELLNFNLVGSESMIGLLASLGTALQQLSDSGKFANFDVPFADATLSDLLNFADDDKKVFSGLIDTLLYDTGGDGVDGAKLDTGKLLKKITDDGKSYLLPAFTTAQTLATRLQTVLEVAIAGPGGINATYDKLTNELTYQVDLRAGDRTAVTHNVAFEHDVALDPFDKLTVDSAAPPADTKVQLTGRSGLDMTFGVNLSPPGPVVFPTTKLKELNGGEAFNGGVGVHIQTVRAITGTKNIATAPLTEPRGPAVFQLTQDADFTISIDGGAPVLVTIPDEATVQWTLADLVADVNNALATAHISDKIEADYDGQRLVLKAKSPATNFSIFSTDTTTETELGFSAGTAANNYDFVIVDRLGVRRGISLDTLNQNSTLQDVINTINGVTGAAVKAEFNATQTGLRLKDTTGGSGKFKVETVNSSGALLDLGLFLTGDDSFDPNNPNTGPNTFGDGDPKLIEGGAIGSTHLDDRFFVRNAQIRIDGLTLKTPDVDGVDNDGDGLIDANDPSEKAGVPGEGLYGIVGVDANIKGQLMANVTAQLTDPGGPGNRITLAELLGQTIELNYDTQQAGVEFTVGGILLGASPGDSAVIFGIRDDTGAADTTGTLLLANVKGAFTDNELLSQQVSDTQTAQASSDGSTVTLANPVVSKVIELKYDTQSSGFPFAEFKVGGLLISATPGDSAVIVGIKNDDSIFDSTGTLLLADVKGTFSDNEALFQDFPGVEFAQALADGTPTAAANFGSFNLGITVQPGFDDPGFDDGFALIKDKHYDLPFDLTGFGEPFTPTAPAHSPLNLNLLGDLKPFDKLSYSHIASTLEGLLDLLRDVDANFTELNTKLPAINRSVGELLSLVDGFERAVGNADAVLDAAIEAIGPNGRGLPALRLQDVPRALRGAFGLPDGVDPDAPGAADWVNLDFDKTANELLLSLDLHDEISTKLGLDIVTGPGLPNLTSAGVLEVFGTLDVKLNTAIDLDTPADVYLLDTSSIAGSLHVQGEGQVYAGGEDGLGLVFRTSLGPLAVFVQDGDVRIDFGFALPGLDFGGSSRKLLKDVVYADFKDPVIAEDQIDIVLPMFYGGEGPDDFIGEYKAVGTVASNTVTAPDFSAIASDITNGVVAYDPFENILLAVDTLDLYLELLSDELSAEVLGIELPFVGDQMGDVLFIEDFRSTLVRTLKNGIENSVNPDPDTKISDLLAGLFAPGGALSGYLMGSIVNTKNTAGVPNSRYRQWNFTVGHQDTITIDDFDIGPDHLTFDVDAPVTVTFDWSIEIGFGVDFGNGAYIEVSDGDELDLDLTVKMPVNMAGTAYPGELGFLSLAVKDPGGDSGAKLLFDVDVKNGNTSEARLGFADIGSLNPEATLTGERLSGAAQATTFKIETTQTRGLPVMTSDFVFDWVLPTTDVETLNGDAVTPGIQKIALNDMKLDALSGIKQLLGEPFEEIANIIKPFMPVVDLLSDPIPVLSDIAGKPFTILDLAEIFGSVDADFIEAVADILDVINTVGSITSLPVLPLGNFTLYDSAAGVDYFDPTDPTKPLGKEALTNATPGLVVAPDFGTTADANPFLNDIRHHNLVDGLSMPIFENPLQGIGLLVNRDAELVTYALPDLGVSFEYLQVFPVWGPLAVSIEISFGFTLDLHEVGFDTYGYRRFADGGFRNEALIFDGFFLGDTENGADVPEVSFEFGLVGAAELNIGIARAGVGGGIDATINFDWHDSIPDGNVHASEIIGNILAENGNPLAPFDVSGELTFELFAFLEISLLGIDEEFPITGKQTLLTFNEDFARAPRLGTVDSGTLYLNMGPNAEDRLNGDTSDGHEEFYLRRVGDDQVKIWSPKLGVKEGDGKTYSGVTKIVGLGGEGDDKIVLYDFDKFGPAITGELEGGVGDDWIEFIPSDANASVDKAGFRIVGGLGNDKLWGSHLNDTITGGEGNDDIKGAGGYDILFGDQGRVAATFISSRIIASDGDDTIDGGAADDIVIGGGGSDTLHGGDGIDLILGDGGRFEYTSTGDHIDVAALRPAAYVPTPVSQPKDPDLISAEIDALQDALLDKIRATDLGFGGNDKIYGDGGHDLAFGGSGDDQIEGNAGDDILLGGKGFDDIKGGSEKDTIFGGDQADTLAGNQGDDVMAGGSGNDFMHGNEDKDVMKGDTGADVMFGDAGDDQVFGQTEPDVLFGGVDNDLVVGGSSNDIMFGDDGLVAKLDPVSGAGVRVIGIGFGGVVPAGQFFDNDVRTLDLILTDVVAGDGNDILSGDAGDDLMLAGGGNDLLGGDVDPRLTSAGTPTELSDDVMIGDGGKITFNQRRFRSIATVIGVDPPVGAPFNDVAYGDNGNDYIFGGRGSDFLFGGHGKLVDVATEMVGNDRGATDVFARDNDTILGDNGEMLFADGTIAANFGRLELVRTTDASNATGGHEYAEGQLGNDVVFGGVNGSVDVLFGNAGSDVMLGDNGELDFALGTDVDLDTLDLIRSYRDGLGGIDIVSGSAGDDVLIGGTAGDEMYGDDAAASNGANDGEDIMLGDNADIFLIGTTGRLKVQIAAMTTGTAVDLITTTDAIDVAHPTAAAAEAAGGPDIMSGNAGNDILLGGVNNDDGSGDPEVDRLYGDRAAPNATTTADDGDDILLGDNGLLDFTFSADADRNTLDLIRSFEDGLGGIDVLSGNKGLDVAIGGTGGDTIYGDDTAASAGASDLADLLLGDNADIFLVAKGVAIGGDLKVVLDAAVKTIRTTDEEHPEYGGSDTISGNAKGDIIAGGVFGDTLYGDRAVPTPTTSSHEGDDIMLGDNGAFEWLSTGRLSEITGIDIGANNPDLYAKYNPGLADDDLTTLDLITTEQPTSGGRDTIYGDEGSDLVWGGTDLDTIHGDDGDEAAETLQTNRDVLFGDHGRLYPQFSTLDGFNSRNFFAIDIGDSAGGEGDRMWGEEGDDVMLGQQGDDRMWGGSNDDDMIGGHNVSGGYDELSLPAVQATLNPPMNDLMDGGSGDDAMTGDNAIVWRRGDDVSPRFRQLTAAAMYTTGPDTITTHVGSQSQSDPDDAVGRDIELVDHADAVQANPQGRFGADVMAGGADSDTLFGELGNDLMQGDGYIGTNDNDSSTITRTLAVTDSGINPDTDETLYFNIPEAVSDADDYMEGNGGHDLMYGGLGQDDMIGGSSALFGLVVEAMRPDGSDTIFGGAGIDIARNHIGDATEDATTHEITTVATGHARDADYIMGDNANVYRLVVGGTVYPVSSTNPADSFFKFNYDNYAGGLRIIPRAMQQLDYTLGGADYRGGIYVDGAAQLVGQPADNGAADLIHGESGDDIIFAMTGSDVVFGEGQDDDVVGGYGNDWISGGTGQDGVLGDDGLLYTSRNSTTGEALYAVAGLLANDPSTKYANGNALNEVISTPGQIQYAVINKSGELKKTVDLVPFSYQVGWNALDDEYADNANNTPFADDIIFGGLGSDFLHGASGDDAISGAEALEHAYVPTYDANGNPAGSVLDLGYAAFVLPNPVNPGDLLALNPNPGDALAFNPVDADGQHLNNRFRAGEFDLYDEYHPRWKVVLGSDGNLLWESSDQNTSYQFLLNFDKTEGVLRFGGSTPGNQNQSVTYPAVRDDGADAIFGDLGNDWLVGGTGRDDMYGGWGNDLLNADDDLETETAGVTEPFDNESPDTHPTYEDRAYGGAGRDVLIGNTGGDRLIDWVGEYNSYLVPYAPFGEASVSRTLQPFLPEFLYALSAGDGADPTRYLDAIGGTPPAPTNNSPNPSRNGEPYGELGLVLQKDFAWQDQTGAPADPQAGNIPGGKRDVLRSADFNSGQAQGFFIDSGTWTVSNGKYQVAPTVAGGDAVSVFYVDQYIPNYVEILATLNAVKPTSGTNANAYLVFDYQTPTDFKFAGVNVSTNKLEVGRRTAQGWIVDKQAAFPSQIKSGTDYNVFLALNGTSVILTVNNQVTMTHTFAARVDVYGISHGLNEGMFGLGAKNAKAQIDNVTVQRVAPAITLTRMDDFASGVGSLLQPPLTGTWTWDAANNGRYDAASLDVNAPAIDLLNVRVAAASLVDLSAKFKTYGQGGLVFDAYSPTDFKFAILSADARNISLGHYTERSGWVTDARYSNASLMAGQDYTLGLSLKGSTVSVTLDGQLVLSRVYNALVTDGGFGLVGHKGASSGLTSFDSVTFKTDDPAFATLLAATQGSGATSALTQAQLDGLIEAAKQAWMMSGVDANGLAVALDEVQFRIEDLQGLALGQTDAHTIWLDSDAAGWGWFIDPTPWQNEEYRRSPDGSLTARQSSQAFGQMDLLTAVRHEMGHVLGYSHTQADDGHAELMDASLAAGVRKLPATASVRYFDESGQFVRAGKHSETVSTAGDDEFLFIPIPGQGQAPSRSDWYNLNDMDQAFGGANQPVLSAHNNEGLLSKTRKAVSRIHWGSSYR